METVTVGTHVWVKINCIIQEGIITKVLKDDFYEILAPINTLDNHTLTVHRNAFFLDGNNAAGLCNIIVADTSEEKDYTARDFTVRLKFDVGSKVWFVDECKIYQGKVESVTVNRGKDETEIFYHITYCTISRKSTGDCEYDKICWGHGDDNLFATKEELIDSLNNNAQEFIEQ